MCSQVATVLKAGALSQCWKQRKEVCWAFEGTSLCRQRGTSYYKRRSRLLSTSLQHAAVVPVQVHLALTGMPSEMRVSWTTEAEG